MKELIKILKQILANQQVIMTVLSENCDEGCKDMINYENGKTTELFTRHIFDKSILNRLYGSIIDEQYVDTDAIKYIKNDIEITKEFYTNKLISDLHDFIGVGEIKVIQTYGIIRVEIYKSDFHFIYATTVVGKTDTELLQEIIKFYINKILSK